MEDILLIFLVILIIWAVVPVIGRWVRRKLIEHLVKRMTGGQASPFGGFTSGTRSGSSPFSDFFRQAAGQQQQHRQQQQHAGERRRVREFMHQVSETVTFEEIADTRAGEPKIRPNVKMESQISDVEWEDIR